MKKTSGDPQCITPAGTRDTIEESKHFMSRARFMTVSKTFQEMLDSPKVNCLIMSPETFESLEGYFKKMAREDPTFCDSSDPAHPVSLKGIPIYIHKWLGDLVVYGNSENSVIKKIIGTCENRTDDIFHQGIKKKEVIT